MSARHTVLACVPTVLIEPAGQAQLYARLNARAALPAGASGEGGSGMSLAELHSASEASFPLCMRNLYGALVGTLLSSGCRLPRPLAVRPEPAMANSSTNNPSARVRTQRT